jgi:hypothetical protein
MESLVMDCCIFSWQKKATKGSSFFAKKKTTRQTSLEWKAGIASAKKMEDGRWEIEDGS